MSGRQDRSVGDRLDARAGGTRTVAAAEKLGFFGESDILTNVSYGGVAGQS
jgi:hypothetical protein